MKETLKQLQYLSGQSMELAAGVLRDAHASICLLEWLGQNLDCDWGTLWKVDSVAHHLRPLATWSLPSVKAPGLERHTHSRNLSLSEGNAGHVWRSQKPIWTVNLISDMCIPRSLDAVGSGLRGGIWFAIKTGHAVHGVVELLGRHLPPSTAELLAEVETLGMRLGEAIESAADVR